MSLVAMISFRRLKMMVIINVQDLLDADGQRQLTVNSYLVAFRHRKSASSNAEKEFKGILHQKIFYRLNLIFWIVMGCGIARFGRRGLKTTET